MAPQKNLESDIFQEGEVLVNKAASEQGPKNAHSDFLRYLVTVTYLFASHLSVWKCFSSWLNLLNISSNIKIPSSYKSLQWNVSRSCKVARYIVCSFYCEKALKRTSETE